ncbi:glucose-6-phosphate 1-dehydrogenase, partial [Reticulomyxa filosa]
GESYDDDKSFIKFAEYLNAVEKEKIALMSLSCDVSESNRLFYFATPPNVFTDLSKNIKKHLSGNHKGWTRVIVEKPFGEDLKSCDDLLRAMGEHLKENQIYRIDHYLAKEMVQNMLVLRFSNTLWDTIWDRRSIKCVKISMKESEGVAGRGGYYDDYGVIRDVFQNHLIQVLCLTAMEAPVSLHDDDIRDEKVKVLKAIESPPLTNVVVGQYGRSLDDKQESYLEDPSIVSKNPKSKQLTFVQMVLFINNKRWAGVPFICKCGKALDARNAEIRIQFKNDGLCLYPNAVFNELAIRLQPSEAIWLRVNTKKPGFARLNSTYSSDLDLTYQSRFDNLVLPGAYTRLILDCLEGDQSLFVRDDELREAWRIVTPLLKKFEGDSSFKPPTYPRGSRGPPEADEMASRYGFLRSPESMKYGEETQRAPHEQKKEISVYKKKKMDTKDEIKNMLPLVFESSNIHVHIFEKEYWNCFKDYQKNSEKKEKLMFESPRSWIDQL